MGECDVDWKDFEQTFQDRLTTIDRVETQIKEAEKVMEMKEEKIKAEIKNTSN